MFYMTVLVGPNTKVVKRLYQKKLLTVTRGSTTQYTEKNWV